MAVMTTDNSPTHAAPEGAGDPLAPRSSGGSGRRGLRPVVVAAVIAVLAIAATVVLVTRGAGDQGAGPTSSVTSPAGSTAVVPGPSSPPPGVATTSTLPPDEAAAVEAWRTVWAATSRAPGSEDAARAVVTDPVIVQRVLGLAGGRDVKSYPTPKVESGGVVSIDECVISEPQFTATPSVGFTGKVERIDSKWKVTELIPRNRQLQPCAPRSMAQTAIEGYRAYWDARSTFWNPADPSSPLVDQTTTGSRRTRLKEVLADHQRRGAVLRGKPTLHPEIAEVRSATEVVIIDCQEGDPTTGIFDAKGERLPDLAPVAPGQRDLNSAVMRLENGIWKVADLQGQTGVTCDFAPTTRGLPVL